MATKLEGEGGKASVAGPLKKELIFFAAFLTCIIGEVAGINISQRDWNHPSGVAPFLFNFGIFFFTNYPFLH